jgi:hypothetical protein
MSAYDVTVAITREETMTIIADTQDEAEQKALDYFEEHENVTGELEIAVSSTAANLEY